MNKSQDEKLHTILVKLECLQKDMLSNRATKNSLDVELMEKAKTELLRCNRS